ncbi:DUF1648 domain-containing protein [Streptomyces profundus]|uniref:DUF1648 domain-containing protein n=1 Tax=Streptomyces profundus TaxID=2867410 RepID=UPI001D16D7F4|nr:DUF1648 domain-containing protein [Streptomyces sp. MA3_2.13]UED83899.1 DUF1648 domain-containing protein [Streptomyces sp. MA3_2.13]
MSKEANTKPVWWLLVPSLSLLLALTVWGVARYPRLPDRIPQHIGPGGVDAWTDKSVLVAFLPVYVYALLTALMVIAAVAMLRTTPADQLPEQENRWARAANAMSNRPASAASARRGAVALLIGNALMGIAFIPMAHVQWRGTETSHVPGWMFAAVLVPLAGGIAPLVIATLRDSAEKRRAREGRAA